MKISSFTVKPTKPLLGAVCLVKKLPAVPEASAAKLTPVSIFFSRSGSALDFLSNPLAASAKLKPLVTEAKGFGSPPLPDDAFVEIDPNVGVLVVLPNPPNILELPPNTGVVVVTALAGLAEGSDFATSAVLGVPPKILVVLEGVFCPKPEPNSCTPSADLFRLPAGAADPKTEGCSNGDFDLSACEGRSAVLGVVLREDEKMEPVAGELELVPDANPVEWRRKMVVMELGSNIFDLIETSRKIAWHGSIKLR